MTVALGVSIISGSDAEVEDEEQGGVVAARRSGIIREGFASLRAVEEKSLHDGGAAGANKAVVISKLRNDGLRWYSCRRRCGETTVRRWSLEQFTTAWCRGSQSPAGGILGSGTRNCRWPTFAASAARKRGALQRSFEEGRQGIVSRNR